jgi:hypothetical protein
MSLKKSKDESKINRNRKLSILRTEIFNSTCQNSFYMS